MALDEAIIQDFIATAGQHHFTSDLPPHLECSICQNLLEDPVVCDNGSHTFCKKCLDDWMSRSIRPLCPIDREVLQVTPQGPRRAPRALQDCIDALEVVCALGCGWKGSKGKWPDHLRRECPEVEDGSDSQRQVRASSVPLAIRREAEEEARAAEEAEALRRHDMQIDDEEEGEDLNDLGAAMLNLNDKKVGAMCDACDADIFNEAYMCMICRDYDLCSECWHDGERSTHSPTHGFVKIRHKDDYYPGERLRRNPYRENNRSTTSSSVTSNRNGGNIHWNINCDGCNEENMVGIRHKCTVCDDFDLCQNCVDNRYIEHETHSEDHEMIRISKPRQAG